MATAYTVAVVGATGVVGQEILTVLAERGFPAGEMRALDSAASAGTQVSCGEQQLRVGELQDDALHEAEVVFLAAGPAASERYARILAARDVAVVDISAHFADDPSVPIAVPEVNLSAVAATGARLIAAPGGATAALAPVLKPLDDVAGVRALSTASYEPVSGVGQHGVSELSGQTVAVLSGQPVDVEAFSRQIAFNCIPAIGEMDAGGHSAAERGLAIDLRRLLNRPDLCVSATAVRVPTFFGLGIAATVDTERPLSATGARTRLREAPGLLVAAEADEYVTPLEAVGSDAIHVSRVRGDPARPNSLALWITIDSVTKGAAVNAVAIAEAMVRYME